MDSLILFLPESICLAAALLLFSLSMLRLPYEVLWRCAVCGAVITAGAAVATLGHVGAPFERGIYQVDLFTQVVKTGLALGLLGVLLLSRRVTTVAQANRLELPMFFFVSTLGMMMLVSATELLTFYVGLEFTAYPIYILVALHRRPALNAEAATKYIVQGGVASAVTLYGISLVFGISRTTYFSELMANGGDLVSQPLFLVGLLLMLSGILFKLAVFPFHFWAPDVYQAGSNQVVTFIATSSKLAAVAVLCRLCALGFAEPDRFMGAFFLLSVASMTLGNLAANAQSDIKRLLAYSTIAHAGYVMVGLYAFNERGLSAALFYALLYLLMVFACFLVVCVVGEGKQTTTLDSFAGLHHRAPVMALTLLTGVFGLAGIPPTAGFIGKWMVFSAALGAQATPGGWEADMRFLLVLIAAINSAVALYYYLQIVRAAYLTPAKNDQPLRVSPGVNVLAVVIVVALLVGGVFPGPLWGVAQRAVGQLLGFQ